MFSLLPEDELGIVGGAWCDGSSRACDSSPGRVGQRVSVRVLADELTQLAGSVLDTAAMTGRGFPASSSNSADQPSKAVKPTTHPATPPRFVAALRVRAPHCVQLKFHYVGTSRVFHVG